MTFIFLAALALAAFYLIVWIRRLYSRPLEPFAVSMPDAWAETVPMEAPKP